MRKHKVEAFRLGMVVFALLSGPAVAAAATDPDLCAELPACRVHERWSAGTDREGRALFVVETRRPARNAYDQECLDDAREFWLLAGDLPPRRVLRLCNDGYGASGVGEDSIEVIAGLLRHQRYGGSNWRGRTVTDIDLDPVAVLRVENESTVASSPGCHLQRVDVAQGRRESWIVPIPDAESEAEFEAEFDDCAFSGPAQALDLPQLQSGFMDESRQASLSAAFDSVIAERQTLGNCALSFATTGSDPSYVLHGQAAGSVQVRALAFDEVHWLVGISAPDREPQAVRSSWIHEDRLELWIGSFQFTWPSDLEIPRQYGITLADGAVFRGSGVEAEDPLPKVVHWSEGAWRWYAIDFSPVATDWDLFSGAVVYGEGDGRKQGLMLSHSRVRYAELSSLAGLWTEYPYACAPQAGRWERQELQAAYADPDHVDPLASQP